MIRTIEIPMNAAPAREVLIQTEMPVTLILPDKKWLILDIAEIWAFRELFAFLCWRDVKVRYKQTVLGGAWAILQPLMTMIVFSVFFARLAKVSSGDIPYPLFAFAGLLPWTFFANAIAGAGQSVVGSERLITKVYFPRLIIPLSAVGAGLVDFAVACGMLGVLMLYYGVFPSTSLLLAPVMVLGLAVAAAGIGSLLAALNVAYRDFRYVIPFMVQLWMFATPTVYMDSRSLVSGIWPWLLPLNPAYGLIANFRAVVLGGPLDLYSLAVSLGVSAVMFAVGTLYFRRVERGFADII
ncbi:ABC transporter permease [Singulisphaera acidiphila]|uniref:Transport permease protein n=1 Tax=Singulisphaera acidiphila (strain ATCC BAA-1392 / DSM 18658 / VKM B-2454 / MOB10) TaxID=886293 RepID=L0DDM7_SINAD|nr:ABC transporter permease [Singulisphaera acidiphila]AGA26771.1 ABC-type polysaccharide/polyol phosphate export systems, permease component [Singulisphaera acidiphila DSM 18658]